MQFPRLVSLVSTIVGAVFLASLARADVLDDVKKRGEIIIGTEAAYIPYEYFKDGKIIGYDPDLADIFFVKGLGVKATFVDTAWNGIIPALLAKKFDIIFSGMTITGERAQRVNFSMPYAEATNVILARIDDDSIKSPEDLNGKVVAATLASAGGKVATEFNAAQKAAGKPGFKDFKTYEHYPEAYVDLANKRVDAVVNSLSSVVPMMNEQKGKFKIVKGIQDLKAYFGVAVRKDDPEMLKFINAQFAAVKSSGELAKLQEKWFGETMETPNEVPEKLP
jgi:polar amino acid transport system substrate-binding protein